MPGPGVASSGLKLPSRTCFEKASLPVPKQKVVSPLTCTAKVEVVLFGLNKLGTS